MPHRVEIDCSTGQARTVPLTPAEQADFDARAADVASAAAAQGSAATQRKTDLATVRAKAATDPAFAALLRTLGVQ